MKYFYIVQRDSQVHEVPYTEQDYMATFKEWQSGGRILIPDPEGVPFGVNAVDIMNIYSADKYSEFIESTRAKKYIKDGSWYDTKEHKLISHTPKKKREIDAQLKLEHDNREEIKHTPVDPEMKSRLDAARIKTRKALEMKGIIPTKNE